MGELIIGLAVFAIGLTLWIRHTLSENGYLLRNVEDFDERDPAVRDALILDLHRLFDLPASSWHPALSRDGITVGTTLTCQALAGPRGVRTYRTVSYLKQDEISVDRMIALLDGGFLQEEVWFKDDFKGGACLETLESAPGRSAWIASYLSEVRPLKMREFVYLLTRRELRPEDFSEHILWQDQAPVRQVCIGYRSVRRPTQTPGRVRAIQYPSLDRISLFADGTICWEHIMAFHIAGALPLWIGNGLIAPASKVLIEEAVNMRKHAIGRPGVATG